MANVLIIDENRDYSQSLHTLVQERGFNATIAANLGEAMKLTREQAIDVVLMNHFSTDSGLANGLQQLHAGPSAPEVIVMADQGSAADAEIAIRHGAWDYIVKTASADSIISPIVRVMNYRANRIAQAKKIGPAAIGRQAGIIGSSALLTDCLETMIQAAGSDASVLITGETGTGKELFAQALHTNSKRSNANFVVVDCAALPETLVESTLFGHEKGAFTGATQKQTGLVKQADGGTLFLDEVGELPLSMQKAFLRVLESHRFRPVGAKDETSSNFRLVAATNQNLDEMVKAGTFRADLLFRLRTFTLVLPSLHKRPGDINALTNYYMTRTCETRPEFAKQISPDFFAALRRHDWPGNVRELFHALECSLVAAREEPTLYPCHLPTELRVKIARSALPGEGRNSTASFGDKGNETGSFITGFNYRQKIQAVRSQAMNLIEGKYLQELMQSTNGNIQEAIDVSGLSRSRLYQLLKDHGIQSPVG